MLGKLLKYDFKWINKIMYVYFILLALISIAVKIVESLDQTIFLVIVDKALSSMFIGCAASTIVTCLIRIWVRFINNIYKDESYLTHTLPVTKNQIFNAKIIASILSILMSGVVVAICFAFIYLNSSTIDALKIRYQSLVDIYNSVFAIFFIIGLVLLVVFESIYIMISGILGIVIGHRFNNGKIIASIGIGIGCYSLLSTMSLVIIGIISNVIDYDIIGNGFPTMNYVTAVGLSSILIYLVYDIVYYFIAKKLLNKGVNVD
ncbi:MAG: hypothetical protein J5892_01675 [Bacilli bacterium]|nr:hypothetical protein [Bacilli bacterium]